MYRMLSMTVSGDHDMENLVFHFCMASDDLEDALWTDLMFNGFIKNWNPANQKNTRMQ